MEHGPGSQRRPRLALLLWTACPELRVRAAAPLELSGLSRRIPARSRQRYTYCMYMEKMNTMNA
jgi:hypothetical protein